MVSAIERELMWPYSSYYILLSKHVKLYIDTLHEFLSRVSFSFITFIHVIYDLVVMFM